MLLKAMAFAGMMALCRLAFRARWQDRTLRHNSQVLRPSKILLFAGAAVVILAPLSSWLMLTTLSELRGSAVAARNATAIASISIAVGLFFVLRSLAPVVLVSKAGLVQRTTFYKTRHLAWRNVVTVRYQAGRGSLLIVGRSASIAIGLMMNGFDGLLERLNSSLPSSISEPALSQIRETMRVLRERRLL